MRLAGRDHTVLDVGCGEGFLAARLRENGNTVTGIDNLESPVHAAEMKEYFQANLQTGLTSVASQLRGQQFDKVLFLDVLEHLLQPERLLKDVRPLLKPAAGTIVVSVPNVANIAVRLMLLFGSFDYADRGILDRTHVRFYTRKTARELLESLGYRIVSEHYSIIPLDRALRLTPNGFAHTFLSKILRFFTMLFPTIFGYQIILEAKPAGLTIPAEPARATLEPAQC
jgi:SAM-dependent methyltransferase